MKKHGRYRIAFLGSVLTILGGAAMVWAADTLVYWVVFKGSPPIALAFPPDSQLSMEGLDFQFTAKTNNLGLRDRDQAPEANSDVFRILCVGDSFTYGWGVEMEDTWVRLLEGHLHVIDGRPVETINAGRPGASPTWYADLAEAAIPLLEPDLIIIGLLQLNDLSDLYFESIKDKPMLESILESTIPTLAPNIWRLAGGRSNTGATYKPVVQGSREIRLLFRQSARMHIQEAGKEGKDLLDALEPAIQDAYKEGVLNPEYLRILLNSDKFPFLEDFYRGNTSHPLVQDAIQAASKALIRIRAIADRGETSVVAVSIPDRAYINEIEVDRLQRIFNRSDKQEIGSQRPDDIFQVICDAADIPLIRTMDAVTEQNANGELYLEYDGHFSVEGNHAFAAIVAERLKPYLPGEVD